MLRWRLLIGIPAVLLLVVLCVLDNYAPLPDYRGIILLPIALFVAVVCSQEVLGLAKSGGLNPVHWPVLVGSPLLVLVCWLDWVNVGLSRCILDFSPLAGSFLVFGIFVIIIILAEMKRYTKPGGITANLATAIFALGYVGIPMAFLMDMRMTCEWGIAAIGTMMIVVKLGDTGAYTFGRLFGKHKMAPILSPGKTIEGAVGAVVSSCLGSWLGFGVLVPLADGPDVSIAFIVAFGCIVGLAGLFGDLVESLLKRDNGKKDSGNLPGFGGALDMLDSILIATPIAWFFVAKMVNCTVCDSYSVFF